MTNTATVPATAAGESLRRRVSGAVLTGALARAATLAVSVAVVPFLVHDLGSEGYGVYVVTAGIAALLPFADLGVSLGLVTRISQCAGAPDAVARRRRLIASATVMLVVSALVLFTAALIVVTTTDVSALLGTQSTKYAGQTSAVVLVVVGNLALSLPANLGPKVLFAVGEQRSANYWQLAAAPVTLVAVVLTALLNGGLVPLVIAVFAPTTLVALLCSLVVFGSRHRDLRPVRAAADKGTAVDLVQLGLVFALQGAAIAVSFQSDALVLSHLRDVHDVASYGLAARFTSLLAVVASLLFVPLWPYFGAAMAEGRLAWVRRVLKLSMAVAAGVAVIGGSLLYVFTPYLVRTWSDGRITVSSQVVFFLVLWGGIQALQQPLSVLMNAAGVKMFQVVCFVALAVVNVAVSIVATRAVGVAGPAIGNAVSTFACLLVPYAVRSHRQLRAAPVSSA